MNKKNKLTGYLRQRTVALFWVFCSMLNAFRTLFVLYWSFVFKFVSIFIAFLTTRRTNGSSKLTATNIIKIIKSGR